MFLLLAFLFVFFLQHLFIVDHNICETDFTSDSNRSLIFLDLLDERFAANVGISWLVLQQVVWRLRAVHFRYLSLNELLGLPHLPLNFFHLLSLCRRSRLHLRLLDFEQLSSNRFKDVL